VCLRTNFTRVSHFFILFLVLSSLRSSLASLKLLSSRLSSKEIVVGAHSSGFKAFFIVNLVVDLAEKFSICARLIQCVFVHRIVFV
jgi:hypothetical protein